MNEYFIKVFVICTVSGILGLLSYNNKNGAERAALGVVLLFVVLSPLVDAISSFDEGKFDPEELISDIQPETGLYDVGAAALCDGICRAIGQEFSLDDGEITATAYGFDIKRMKAEKIRILLTGRAAFADCKAIKEFVEKMEVGECEVGIEIG